LVAESDGRINLENSIKNYEQEILKLKNDIETQRKNFQEIERLRGQDRQTQEELQARLDSEGKQHGEDKKETFKNPERIGKDQRRFV